MILRDAKRGPFLGCSSIPNAGAPSGSRKLEGDDLKQVEALLPLLKEEAGKARDLVAKITGEIPASASNGSAATHNLATDIDCEECGKPMVIRTGRRGKFLGCSGYPKCKNTAEVPAKLLEQLGLSNGNGSVPKNSAPAHEPHEESEH